MKKLTISLLLMSTVTLAGCTTAATNIGKESNNSGTIDEMSLVDIDTERADDALERLKRGNRLYINDKSQVMDISSERRAELTKGQNPFAVVVSCSDSRVVTSHIFNTGVGDIFDIKLAGNVIDDLALGSIEYGVEHLGIKLLVVMGHESCGAVTAAYNSVNEDEEVHGNIASITNKIEPVISGATSIEEASHNNVNSVIEEIKKDEAIKKLVDSGELKIVSAYYNLNGEVEFLENN
ncbi:MAG: carbonic anhydrase [Clostridium perfringens]|nr:carbonic anhydrase [Clostridium perfringens]